MSADRSLAGNLARFRRRNRRLARAVETAALDGIEIRTGPRGARTVSRDDVLLGSAYDPEGEGRRLAREMDRQPADLVVALGFGLGHHLEAYRQRNRCPLIVYEPSLASLRAVLSAREGLTFLEEPDVLLVSELDHLDQALTARYTPGVRVRVYPHPAMLRLDPGAARKAVDRVRRVKDTLDVNANTRISDLRAWTGFTARNAGRILETPPFSDLVGRFSGVPAVVVGAGPSLDAQLPALREARDRVLVVCIGQALGALRSAGIEPDLVHVIESQPVAHQLERCGGADDLYVVVTPDVDPTLFGVPVRGRFVAYPLSDQLGHWIGAALGESFWVMGGGTVTHGAVGLAAALGASPVMLIGQDLAYTDGRAYATGSAYDCVGVSIGDDDRYRLTGNSVRRELLGLPPAEDGEQDLLWVEGWGGGRVPTSMAYLSFIEHYRGIAVLLERADIRLVNCTEGGAHLPGVEHRGFRETLDALPARPVDARARIGEVHAAWQPPAPGRLRGAAQEARKALARIGALARDGLRGAVAAERELGRARAPEHQIQILRRVGRAERELRKQLQTLPWLDALVQPELYASLAAHARSRSAPPTPREATAEAAFLFRATLAAAGRAREVLSQVVAGLPGSSAVLKRSRDRSETVSVS